MTWLDRARRATMSDSRTNRFTLRFMDPWLERRFLAHVSQFSFMQVSSILLLICCVLVVGAFMFDVGFSEGSDVLFATEGAELKIRRLHPKPGLLLYFPFSLLMMIAGILFFLSDRVSLPRVRKWASAVFFGAILVTPSIGVLMIPMNKVELHECQTVPLSLTTVDPLMFDVPDAMPSVPPSLVEDVFAQCMGNGTCTPNSRLTCEQTSGTLALMMHTYAFRREEDRARRVHSRSVFIATATLLLGRVRFPVLLML
ncbi:MAG: hypothetical protein MHM6MM_009201 [Cercozoa sp. M6MM]